MELTGLCEGNIEEWHQKKFLKYDPLAASVLGNGWSVYFFTVEEVGARGYPSTYLKFCLLRLGFSCNLVQPILKSPCLTSSAESKDGHLDVSQEAASHYKQIQRHLINQTNN